MGEQRLMLNREIVEQNVSTGSVEKNSE